MDDLSISEALTKKYINNLDRNLKTKMLSLIRIIQCSNIVAYCAHFGFETKPKRKFDLKFNQFTGVLNNDSHNRNN